MSTERVNAVRTNMKKHNIDALIITNLENIRYVTGFTGSTAIGVITKDRAVILVDSRYILQAKKECSGVEAVLFSGDWIETVAPIIAESKAERVGFEQDYVTISLHKKMRKAVSKPAKLVGVSRTVEEIRIVKDADEIQTIKRAAAITDECFSHLLEFIKPGMTERDVALEIYLYFYNQDANLAFGSIVAAGENAAFPHHKTGNDTIKKGQMLKLDFGAMVDGYNADLTRTIFVGNPPDAKQKEIYQIVLDAQMKAIDAIKPGKKGKQIDAVARKYIESKGYGEYFGHGLGHSLGIGVHDGPGFAPTSETVLEPGMVMTVEPGIYIEGWGGVRIEDDILVTEDGCEVLTKSRKDITVI